MTRGVCEADKEHYMKAVVERTDIVKEGEKIYFIDDEGGKVPLSGDEPVSMNFWGFTSTIFDHFEKAFRDFIRENARKPKKELYIPTVVNDLVASGLVSVKILPSSDPWFGITYRQDKPVAVEHIRRLVEQGVYPEKLWS